MSVNISLTQTDYWDKYWEDYCLPVQANYAAGNFLLNAQLDVLNHYLPVDSRKTALEIGGAPGQYLAFLAQNHKYRAYALDYSPVGCSKIIENFKLLHLDVIVYQRDLLLNLNDLPRFDVVISLGVIEHFSDIDLVVQKHLELLKPGGFLVLGVPAFIKVFAPILQQLAPNTFASHYIDSLNIRNWISFETKNQLEIIFKGYIGGFEPLLLRSVLSQEAGSIGIKKIIRNRLMSLLDFYGRGRRKINRIFPSASRLNQFNSRYWSCYAMAVYRKPY